MVPDWPRFEPDATTQAVMQDVSRLFPDNPGSLEDFNWPVTREQALVQLDDFIANRLPAFGPFQDAMWQDEPFLYHSLLAAALNGAWLVFRVVYYADLLPNTFYLKDDAQPMLGLLYLWDLVAPYQVIPFVLLGAALLAAAPLMPDRRIGLPG